MDKAINADSDNAPKQLRAILLTENPQWKLPERRVARYLKRHLKARKDPMADEIVADMDEETVYTMTSSSPAQEDMLVEAYTDEDTAKKTVSAKPLLCDGLQCVIS